MAIDKPNAVYLGHGRDRFGFPVEVLEDPLTKQQLLAYDPDIWVQRQQFLHHLRELELREEQAEADTVTLTGVPRNAWPAKPGRPSAD